MATVFSALGPDLTCDIERRQQAAIRLWAKLARFERLRGDSAPLTDAVEGTMDRVLLELIARGDFSAIEEVEAPWVAPHAAFECLLEFARTAPDQIVVDCTTFYNQFIDSPDVPLVVAALCAAQAVVGIDEDFCGQQAQNFIDLAAHGETLVRLSAFSVILQMVETRFEMFDEEVQLRAIFDVVAFGLKADFATARRAILLLVTVCQKFSADADQSFIGQYFDEILGQLLEAAERPDVLSERLLEELYDAIGCLVTATPTSRTNSLIDVFRRFVERLETTADASSADGHRLRYSLLTVIIALSRRLEELIVPFVQHVMQLLFAIIEGTSRPEDIFLAIEQVLYVCPVDVIMPFVPNLMLLFEAAQATGSPDLVKYSAMIVSDLFVGVRRPMIEFATQTLGVLCENVMNQATLYVTQGFLVAAISDVISAYGGEDECGIEIEPIMNVLQNIVKQMPFVIADDFEAATMIAESMMNAFGEIVVHFLDDGDFLIANTVPYFLQLPTMVWRNRMITAKSVEYFLKLLNNLIRTVGPKLKVEMRKGEIRDFLKFAGDGQSPFPHLVPFAVDVRKFYEYL
jgi:hypothetical protein